MFEEEKEFTPQKSNIPQVLTIILIIIILIFFGKKIYFFLEAELLKYLK